MFFVAENWAPSVHTSNKSVHDCKLKFLHTANKIIVLARAGRRDGLWPSKAFPGFAANMASFLRKEIQAAVREELLCVISSTGTAASSNSNLMTPSSGVTSRLAKENSERTLLFEEERQEGFRPPKKWRKSCWKTAACSLSQLLSCMKRLHMFP